MVSPALRRLSALAGLVLGACGLWSLAGRASAPGPAKLALFIAADVRGYLEPCGCSEHMLGGIDRFGGQVRRGEKEQGTALVIAAGDVLAPGTARNEAEAVQATSQATFLGRALTELGVGAVVLGPRDLALPEAVRTELAKTLPLLPAPGGRMVERGGIRIGIASGERIELLIAAAQQLRGPEQQAEWVVATSALPVAQLSAAAEELSRAGIDAVVAFHAARDLDGEEDRQLEAALPILQLRNRGRATLRVDLERVAGAPPGFVRVQSDEGQARELAQRDAEIQSLEARAAAAEGPLKQAIDAKVLEKRTARAALASTHPAPPPGRSWFALRFIPLSDDLPADPAMQKVIADATEAAGRANLAWAKAHGQDCPAPKAGETAFVGTATCIGCHTEPGEVWKKSGHAHAYATLEAKKKQFDLGCVKCHVIGTEAPGGVCRVDQVKGRENVGCESCHGRGSLHADDPSAVAIPVKRPTEATCVACHTPENSTHFEFQSYLPRILGPGHGKPSP